jgi:hypothetical protein
MIVPGKAAARASSFWRMFFMFVSGPLLLSWSGFEYLRRVPSTRMSDPALISAFVGVTFFISIVLVFFVGFALWKSQRTPSVIALLLAVAAVLYLMLIPSVSLSIL